jgi:hypothetical protein
MKKSQTQKILRFLKRGFSITPLYALKKWGCFGLASRISELREDGVRIRKRMVHNKFTGKHYASYRLEA